MQNFKISIVVPIMNEEGNVSILVENIKKVLKNNSDWELIFVDDGSKDNTLKSVKKENSKNSKVKFISFSRNFGHQNALRAGFDFATGDCVICMDGDMQHPPKLIPEMIKKWQDGYDIVYTKRLDDPKTSLAKRKTASIFYGIMNKFSDIKIDQGAADFRLVDRKVADVIKTIREDNLFMRGMISWLGFKQYGIKYNPEERHWGKTKYTFKKMFKFAVAGIMSFSIKPLQISLFVGYFMAIISFVYAVYAIYMKLFTTETISGWTSVLVAVLFIGGIQMIMLGILGEYVGKLFMESKRRPNYIIKEKNV